MPNYIETRPEAIKAIHKCIVEKWNPICMGCVTQEPRCSLCDEYQDGNWGFCNCKDCPLGKANMICNIDPGNPYEVWDKANDCHNCPKQDDKKCDLECPSVISCPAEAEAILEALVMLLPESERAVYGG